MHVTFLDQDPTALRSSTAVLDAATDSCRGASRQEKFGTVFSYRLARRGSPTGAMVWDVGGVLVPLHPAEPGTEKAAYLCAQIGERWWQVDGPP